jgi:hypothetical protein
VIIAACVFFMTVLWLILIFEELSTGAFFLVISLIGLDAMILITNLATGGA